MSIAAVGHAAGYGRSDGVDILRFLAMIFVVAQHCDLVPFGWFGVWLFYVVSGFVVTKSIKIDSDIRKSDKIILFYKRRILRIVPSYLFFILFAIFVLNISRNPPPISEVWDFILFNANVKMATDHLWRPEFPMSHLWTISVEMKFYAVVGLFLILLDRKWLNRFLIALLVLSPIARLLFDLRYGGPVAYGYIQHLAVFNADAFAAGCLMALWSEKLDRRLGLGILGAGVVLMAAYVTVYIYCNITFRHASGLLALHDIISGEVVGQLREVFIYTPLVVVFSGLVCLAYLTPAPTSSLASRVAAWGRASYSGYLWHFAVIVAVKGMLGLAGLRFDAGWDAIPAKILLFVTSAILLAPLSLVLQEWVERLGARGGGRLFAWIERKVVGLRDQARADA